MRRKSIRCWKKSGELKLSDIVLVQMGWVVNMASHSIKQYFIILASDLKNANFSSCTSVRDYRHFKHEPKLHYGCQTTLSAYITVRDVNRRGVESDKMPDHFQLIICLDSRAVRSLRSSNRSWHCTDSGGGQGHISTYIKGEQREIIGRGPRLNWQLP